MTVKMLRNAALLLIVLVWAACQAGPKEHVLYYNDGGAVLRRYFTENDRKEGKMFEYYQDGKVKVERTFVNDLEQGPVSTYYPDGKIKERQYYRDAVLQGADTIWHPDGRLQRITNFRDGKIDGEMRVWNPDGSLLFEARYQMDSLLEMKKAPTVAPGTGNQ